jgi:tetratricopeptide (TPR) repeat protein
MRSVTVGLSLTAAIAWGQLSGGGSLGGGFGGAGRPSVGNRPSVADSPAQRSVFISVKVALADGAALSEPAKIDRLCSGTARSVAHTDLKGRFSFELYHSTEIADASTEAGDGIGNFPAQRGGRIPSLLGCELRISLPGFRTESVSLSDDRFFDNPDLGTIILHRLANVDGLTVSATAALAPKDAKKAYEKGMEAVAKKNAAEAQKNFEKAVGIYPRYAAAWYELGMLGEQKNLFDDARKSYQQAIAADAKYVPPHERLGWIALRESKWQEVADESDAVLRLDPIDYPDSYYLSAVGNLQLGNLNAAEKNAREAVDRDKAHKNTRAPYVLALALARKGDFKSAAPLLRSFLEKNPDLPDAADIRQQLASIEDAAKTQQPSPQ